MQKYVERMFSEKKELDGRISRAKKAVESPPYGADSESIELLKEQVGYMESYSSILQKRIDKERG
ncbi:MAG: hypothetical protein IKF66_01160 [Methanobrevibacter sp.]|nr:hypothetical protein [Methanobrevibacter sp.]